MHNPQQLMMMEQKQLLVLCARLNIPAHHRTGKPKLIEFILQNNVAEEENLQKPSERVKRDKAQAVEQQQADINNVIARYNGVSVQYHADKTYTANFAGIVESFHATTPLDVLERALGKLTSARYPAKDKMNGEAVLV